jgi:2-keto-3-deoxy-L-rhamnonate aldolase RhmA
MNSHNQNTSTPEIGTFVKTAAPQIIEILGGAGLHFVVVDAEHAPFDRLALDLMIIAGRSVRLPIFVRIPDMQASTIQSALDLGASGLLVPHVDSADAARTLVARTRFINGERGFSSSPRFADYGAMGMKRAIESGNGTTIMCQIESREGVDAAEAIASVPGVSGLFVGRADLALSFGLTDSRAPEVIDATVNVLDIARRTGKTPGVAIGDPSEREEFARMGATWFVIGSDQSLLRKGALSLIA